MGEEIKNRIAKIVIVVALIAIVLACLYYRSWNDPMVQQVEGVIEAQHTLVSP